MADLHVPLQRPQDVGKDLVQLGQRGPVTRIVSTQLVGSTFRRARPPPPPSHLHLLSICELMAIHCDEALEQKPDADSLRWRQTPFARFVHSVARFREHEIADFGIVAKDKRPPWRQNAHRIDSALVSTRDSCSACAPTNSPRRSESASSARSRRRTRRVEVVVLRDRQSEKYEVQRVGAHVPHAPRPKIEIPDLDCCWLGYALAQQHHGRNHSWDAEVCDGVPAHHCVCTHLCV